MEHALQSSFVLHTRPYRDSSLIMELFTLEHGRLGVVARGARSKKANLSGLYQPFVPVLASWFGRGELYTLDKIEAAGIAYELTGKSLYSGFYINELIMRLVHRNDPHPLLFSRYLDTLTYFQTSPDIEVSLRCFEKCLLQEIGYGLLLEHDAVTGAKIDANKHYMYQSEHGPVIVNDSIDEGLIISGQTLISIYNDQYDDAQSLVEAKKLMRREIANHLGGKPLKSRNLYIQQQNVL